MRIEIRVTKEQKQQIAGLARKCRLSQSEYLRQRALGFDPKGTLPDAFFVCCERLDRLTRAPYAKSVNDAALAVLIEMQNILTGNTVLPVEKANAVPEPEPQRTESTPKHRLFGRR